MTARSGQIRVGIDDWTFEPWRGVFYPKGLPHAKELACASTHFASIEVNGTFYRTQTPASRPTPRRRDSARRMRPPSHCFQAMARNNEEPPAGKRRGQNLRGKLKRVKKPFVRG
jgi:Protein of unknown function DUF72